MWCFMAYNGAIWYSEIGANMALVELTLKQRYLSKDVFNVFHYFCESNNGRNIATFTALATKFETDVMPLLNAIQVNGVSNESIKILDLGNANLQTEKLVGDGGTATANGDLWLPRAATYPVKLAVAESHRVSDRSVYVGNRRITNGYKRFTGVNEAYVSNGEWAETFETGAAILALTNELNDDIVTNVTESLTWVPTVYGRPVDAESPAGAREALYAAITGASLQPFGWTAKRK